MLEAALAQIAERHHIDPGLLADIRATIGPLIPSKALETLAGYSGSPVPGPETPTMPSAQASDVPRDVITGDYEDLGLLATGGMGEVRRVRDRVLNRTVCLKVIRTSLLRRPHALARFIEEAQVTAQLQHPGIVPVHELGRLDDGRPFFTMKEVRGRTFDEVIRDVHQVSDDRWCAAENGWTFRRLIETFHRVCQAVAYAHTRDVVHRDLKPDNIMVGDFGEVHVMDWGLAKVLGQQPEPAEEDPTVEESVVTDRSLGRSHATSFGTVAGTPAYMAPEQARGDVTAIDVRTDVYALGAVLYEVLVGRRAYEGPDGSSILGMVLEGPPIPLLPWFGPDLPPELVETCDKAMARDPADRYATAAALADDVQAWIHGTKRRERALAVVEQAAATVTERDSLGARAADLRARAARHLEGVATWASEVAKARGWALEDEATALEREATLKAVEREQLLKAALTHAPDLPDAHATLAEDYRALHAAAEAARDEAGMARAEILLRQHTEALPERHETGRACAAYLVGDGALTLVTDPPGAEVLLHRFVLQNRRLVPVLDRSLGRTPLESVPLPMGSYLLRLARDGFDTVRYPVSIDRQQHWEGVPPGEVAPAPVWLPPAGALGPLDHYVPGGWFWAGGDPEAARSLPRRRRWQAGFVMRRFPVTNTDYVAFLDDLVAAGHDEEALRWVPRDRGQGEQGERGVMIYGRDAGGRFVLVADADGDVWLPDYPVVMVDWESAGAYAAWEAARTGLAWRLPHELEWEKASRGVDGRFFPWGDFLDPSWCCMGTSHAGPRKPQLVDSYPVDESPYGVRGLAGNVRDWCVDAWDEGGPPEREPAAWEGNRSLRGGSWTDSRYLRSAVRLPLAPARRFADLGFRLARPV